MNEYYNYDKLTFPREVAERMVIIAKLSPGQLVLDVACGTGWATIAAAKAVGLKGKITGIDVEKNCLDIAKEKTVKAGISNVEHLWGDAEALDFDNDSFDALLCASGVMWFKDLPKALREWYRVLKPGGTVSFTSFGTRFLQPVIKPLGECLSRFDGQPAAVPSFIETTDNSEKCRELLRNAGFMKIEITMESLDSRYSNIASYWQEITLTFIRRRLARLSPTDLERLKAEHLAEMKSLYSDRDIVMEIPTIISVAKKLQ